MLGKKRKNFTEIGGSRVFENTYGSTGDIFLPVKGQIVSLPNIATGNLLTSDGSGNIVDSGVNIVTITNSIGTEVTSTSLLIQNAIPKGVISSRQIVSSGWLIDSSNNLKTTKDGSGYMYLETALTFASKALNAGREYGIYFTLSSSINVTAFRFYRLANSDTIRTIRLWSGTGTLITSVSINSAVNNAWATSGAVSLSLTAGNYCLSFTGDPLSIVPGTWTSPGYPSTQNGISLTGAYFNMTGAQFPATTMGVTYFLGVDLVWSTTYDLNLNLPTLTNTRTLNYPDLTGNFVLDTSPMLALMLNCGTAGYKCDSFYAQFDNSVFTTTTSNFNITGKGWVTPLGNFEMNVTGGYYTNTPVLIMPVCSAGVSNPLGVYMAYPAQTSSQSSTLIKIFGFSGGAAALNIFTIMIGK